MKIKEGYNGKELKIKISGRKNESGELWIEQDGLPDEIERYKETLSYISLQELLDLKVEIEDAILEITGINK